MINKNQKNYSYWDYQAELGKDNGIRIVLILLSSETADLLNNAGIHKEVRGKKDKRPRSGLDKCLNSKYIFFGLKFSFQVF